MRVDNVPHTTLLVVCSEMAILAFLVIAFHSLIHQNANNKMKKVKAKAAQTTANPAHYKPRIYTMTMREQMSMVSEPQMPNEPATVCAMGIPNELANAVSEAITNAMQNATLYERFLLFLRG